MASSPALDSMKWSLYPNEGYEHFSFEAPWWARIVILFDVVAFFPLVLIVCNARSKAAS